MQLLFLYFTKFCYFFLFFSLCPMIPFPLRREWLRTCASKRSGRTGLGWKSWNKCGRRTKNWRTSCRPCSLQTLPRIRPQTPAWPRTRGLTGRLVHMSPSRRMVVVLMTDDINTLGKSKTKYKSRQRKERGARQIKAVFLVRVLMAGIFHFQIITEMNKQQQRQILNSQTHNVVLYTLLK